MPADTAPPVKLIETRRGPARRSRSVWIATVVLAITAGIAAVDLVDQMAIAESRNAVASQSAQLTRGGSARFDLPVLPLEGSPDVLVLNALRVARSAATLPPNAERRRLVAEAVRAAERGAAARPNWGEAEIVIAYASSLGSDRSDGVRARDALAASYADAPFLHDGGLWRVRYGVQAWPALGKATREAILREGVWLLGVDLDWWAPVFGTFRGSPAYIPFMLRWRDVMTGTPRSRANGLTETQADQN